MPYANLIVESPDGPERFLAFFEQTDGTEEDTPIGGYLYISDQQSNEIVNAVEISQVPLLLEPEDVKIFWSADGLKCGVAIWGRMRAVISVASGEQVRVALDSQQSQAVDDPRALEGFDMYLDHYRFIRARQRFWKAEAQYQDAQVQSQPESITPIETNFIIYEKGPDGLFAVFEDDGHSGYLYLYEAKTQEIVEQVHNYDTSDKMRVRPQDVEIVWSRNGLKCGVLIWKKMRGIIDRQLRRPGRVWMEDENSPGIVDLQWLTGFE
jgi:hypothetical protein